MCLCDREFFVHVSSFYAKVSHDERTRLICFVFVTLIERQPEMQEEAKFHLQFLESRECGV